MASSSWSLSTIRRIWRMYWACLCFSFSILCFSFSTLCCSLSRSFSCSLLKNISTWLFIYLHMMEIAWLTAFRILKLSSWSLQFSHKTASFLLLYLSLNDRKISPKDSVLSFSSLQKETRWLFFSFLYSYLLIVLQTCITWPSKLFPSPSPSSSEISAYKQKTILLAQKPYLKYV